MKKILSLLILFTCSIVFAQDISGKWNGLLAAPGQQIKIVLNISKTQAGYTATMDSPDQGANGIPVDNVTFDNNTLTFAIPAARLEYKGTFENNGFKGVTTQNGTAMDLNFSRDEVKAAKVKRPQDPVKPYPYHSEDVTFKNESAGITLAGTLTLPTKEGNYPAVVLITGSSAQNRDEEILGHKPFLVLADHLTKNGIAVLRYDDRGVAESQGDFDAATTQDFATDAEAAFLYLKSPGNTVVCSS